MLDPLACWGIHALFPHILVWSLSSSIVMNFAGYSSVLQVYPPFPGKFLISFCTQSREIQRNCFFSLLRLFLLLVCSKYNTEVEKRFSLHFLHCSIMKIRCSLFLPYPPLHFRKYFLSAILFTSFFCFMNNALW